MAAADTGKNIPSKPSPWTRVLRRLAMLRGLLSAIATKLQTFNSWLALKLNLSKFWADQMVKVEIGFLLTAGATLIQLGEYAFAVAFCIALALIWISKVLNSQSLSGGERTIGLKKAAHVILALFVTTMMIVWTDIKRDDQDWSNYQKLFPGTKPKILAISNNKEYEAGTAREGIPWSSEYTELDVVINNPTDGSYEDVNLVIRPDYPVARFTQMSNLPGVSFEDKMGLTVILTAEETPIPGGPFGPATSYVIIANSVGYRVHCDRIPPKSSLRFLMALVDVPKADKTLQYKPGMILPPLDKEDITGELSYGEEGSYWFAIPGIRRHFKARPSPTFITVSGSYLANGKREHVKRKVPTT